MLILHPTLQSERMTSIDHHTNAPWCWTYGWILSKDDNGGRFEKGKKKGGGWLSVVLKAPVPSLSYCYDLASPLTNFNSYILAIHSKQFFLYAKVTISAPCAFINWNRNKGIYIFLIPGYYPLCFSYTITIPFIILFSNSPVKYTIFYP